MEPKYLKIFSKSAESYCKLNNIEDVDGFIKKCFDTGFNIEKYGLLEKPLNEGEKHLKTGIVGEKQVEIEVIREIRVEVPVEIIKEVEVIKEVIVEKEVIKEVEKIVTITNNEELEEKIFQLNSDLESERKIFSTKTEEMENSFQKEMSKKDEELDELRRNLDEKLDDTNQKMLQETLQKLRKEISDKNEKIKELIKINQDLQNTRQNKLNAVFLRGSNINDTI
jgi:DNA repair exonuclease SbcCD ATPase subunit